MPALVVQAQRDPVVAGEGETADVRRGGRQEAAIAAASLPVTVITLAGLVFPGRRAGNIAAASASVACSRAARASCQESRASPGTGATRIGRVRGAAVMMRRLRRDREGTAAGRSACQS